jgi:carbamoyl-phosphate synthase large subunit
MSKDILVASEKETSQEKPNHPNPVNVLVYPSGTEIGLEIGRQLRFSKNFHAVGANSVADHSQFVFDDLELGLPSVGEAILAQKLRALCGKRDIRFFIPAHDEAVYLLADSDLSPATYIGPTPEIAGILRFKSRTYEQFLSADFLPRIFSSVDDVSDLDFPVFVRPDRGQGSVGAHQVATRSKLEDHRSLWHEYIVTEYLPGNEFTVDCYTSRDGRLQLISARRRLRIKTGISVRAEEVPAAPFVAIAEIISRQLKLQGPWFFQCKENRCGEVKLLEVASRISGTMGFQRIKGFNLVEAALWEAMGKSVRLPPNRILPIVYDRALLEEVALDFPVRTVYVDFDDTLVLPSGALNYELVGYLFGLKSIRSATLVLVTRHAGEPRARLRHFGLEALFEQVVHLDREAPKSSVVNGPGVIFIDDSFSERIEVQTRSPEALCLGPEGQSVLKGLLRVSPGIE